MLTGTKRAAAVVVVILNCCGLALANATNVGVATNTVPQSIGSGSWKVVPSTTSISPVIRDTSAVVGSIKGSYFNLTNTGTLQTISFTIGQVTSGTGNYTVLLKYCRISVSTSALWNLTTGACPAGSTATTMITNTNASTNSAVVTYTMAAGASINVQAQYNATANRTISDAISVTVTRANVRTATATNG